MKASGNPGARKRPVNLTLNAELVEEARNIAGNLSGIVEELLAGYVAQERHRRQARKKALAATVAVWNAFGDSHGSFADDHSTL